MPEARGEIQRERGKDRVFRDRLLVHVLAAYWVGRRLMSKRIASAPQSGNATANAVLRSRESRPKST